MISEKDVQTYKSDGVIVVPDILETQRQPSALGHRGTGCGVGEDTRAHGCL